MRVQPSLIKAGVRPSRLHPSSPFIPAPYPIETIGVNGKGEEGSRVCSFFFSGGGGRPQQPWEGLPSRPSEAWPWWSWG